MEILVTGGAGFIGSNFIWYLLREYDDIRIINIDKLTYSGNLNNLMGIEEYSGNRYQFIKGDITHRKTVSEIFTKYDIDYIINFAAESHVDRSIESPGIFIETNIKGTQVLLDSGRDNNIRKFIQISTDEVYGSLGSTGRFSETTPLAPQSPYSASKASADFFVQAYYNTYKLPVNITRCSNNYGPYQFPEKVIPLAINNILTGKKIPVYGDGKNIRDWIYVNDHCRAIDIVLRKGKNGEVYNIGSDNEWQNIDMIKLIIKIFKDIIDENESYANLIKTDVNDLNDELVEFVTDRPGHDRRYAIDSDKIRSQLDWHPEYTDFYNGLKETILWYLNNNEWLENVVSGVYKEYYSRLYDNSY